MVNIYTTSFHPENPDEPVPWYEIVENEIYTTLYHPTHPQEPVSWYVIRDQKIFTSPDHPTNPAPARGQDGDCRAGRARRSVAERGRDGLDPDGQPPRG